MAPRVQPGILPAATVEYQNQPSPLESANPLPLRTQDYQRRQAAEEVGVAQYLARKGGSPEDAAKIATGMAASSLDPKNGSLIAQATPPEAEPYDSWRVLTQSDKYAALTSALRRKEFAQQAKDDVAVLARAADIIFDPLPTSRPGELWDHASLGDQRARLAAKVVAGTATDADKAEMKKLEARLRLMPEAKGFKDKAFGLTVGMLPMLAKGLEYGGIAAVPGAVVGGAIGSLAGPGGTLAGAKVGAQFAGGAGNLYANVEADVGNSYLEIKDLRDETGKLISDNVARGTAAITGLISGSIGTYGAGKILGAFGAGASAAVSRDAKKVIAAAGVKQVVAATLKIPLARDLMEQFITQGSVGAAMEFVKIMGVQAAAIVAEGKFKTPGRDESIHRIGEGAISMALGGTLMHAATVSAPRMVAQRMVGQAEAGHAGAKPVEAMYDLADQSKLQKRNPVALRDYLADAARDGNVKDLSAPLEALQTLFDKEGVSPEQVREKMPQVAAQMREAAITGARVRVPVADFIAHIATLDKGRTLKDDLGLGDRPSVREAKLIDAEVEKAVKSVMGGGTAEVPDGSPLGRVIRDLTLKYRTEIPASPQRDVEMRVSLLAAAIESVATRSGQDAWEMFMAAPIDVVAEGHPSRAVELFLGKAKGLKTPEEVQAAAKETIGERTTVWRDLSEAEHADLLAAGDKATIPAGPVLFDLPPRATSRGKPIALNILTSEITGLTPGRGANIVEIPVIRATKGLQDSKSFFDQTVRGRPVEGEGGQGVRGSLAFDDARNWFTLTLTGKASLATFTHEGAHYSLEILRKAVMAGLANEELTADLRTLEKWTGTAEGARWNRDALEKFARGFETYLGEGVAPTKGLERVFATMKSWVLNVYKRLANLGAPLNDDVRKVMDRLVSSEEAVKQIATEQHMEPMVFAPGDMTPEEYVAYLAVQQRGQREAMVRITQQAIAGLRAEKTETYKAIKEKVAADLNKNPAYNARQFFKDGTTLDGRVVPETLKGKLDMGVVEGMGLDARHINALVRENLAELGGPVHPDELAPFLGFANGTEMIRAMVDAPARRTIESAEVKRQMVEIFPNYGAKEWIEKTAIESLDRDATATKIQMELMMFARRAKLPPPVNPKVVAHEAALRITAERRLSETNPEQYRQAEAAAAKAKLKAYGNKDYEAAMEFARQEITNGYLWRMAEKSVAEAATVKKYAERFLDKVTQAKIGRVGEMIPDPKNPDGLPIREGALFRDVLHAISENALNPYRWFRAGESMASARLNVAATLTALEGEGYFFPRVDPMFREGHGLKFEDMTPEQVRSFRDSLKSIEYMANTIGRLDFGTIELRKLGLTAADLGISEDDFSKGRVNKKFIEKKLIDSIDSDLAGRLAHEYGDKRKELSKLTEIAQRVRYFRAAVIKPETVWTDLDGGKPGLWHKIMFQPLKEAEMRQLVLQKAFAADHDKIIAEHPEYRKMRDQRAVFVDGRTYTHAELLGVIVNLANKGNREKMFQGAEDVGRTGWNLENVTKRLHEIFPEQKTWDLAQKLIDLAGAHKEQLFNVSERSTGVPLDPVHNASIPTPNGPDLPGGYWPIQYDTHIPEKASPGEKTMAEKWDNFIPGAYIPKSMTKERTQAVGMMMLDPTKVLAAKTYESAHYITHFEPLVAIDRLLRSNPIREALYKSVGEEYYRTLKNSIGYVANEGRMLTDENNAVTNFTNRLISGNAIVSMGFNLKSAARQITDISAAMAKVGPVYTTKAVTKFLMRPMSFVREAMDASPEVDAAMNIPDRDLRRMTLKTDMSSTGMTKEQINKWAIWPTLTMQTFVNAITFDAALQRGVDEGMSPTAAVKYAEHMIRSSQSSGGAVDLAALQRNADPMARMLTSLASYTFTLNDMFMPARMTKGEWAEKGAQIGRYFLAMTMMKAAAAAVLNSEEENKKRKKSFGTDSEVAMAAFESALEVVGAVPVAGRPIASALEGRPARWGSWADSFGIAARGGVDVLRGKGGDLKTNTLKTAADIPGLLLHFPTRNLLFRPGEYLYELQQGHIEEPVKDLLFTPAGKIGRTR